MSIVLVASSITTLHHHRLVQTGLHQSPRCPPRDFPGINREDMEVIQTMEGVYFFFGEGADQAEHCLFQQTTLAANSFPPPCAFPQGGLPVLSFPSKPPLPPLLPAPQLKAENLFRVTIMWTDIRDGATLG